jgi:hypothetical protein
MRKFNKSLNKSWLKFYPVYMNKRVHLGTTTLSITTISIMTVSIMTLSTKGVFVTLSINDTQHKRQSAKSSSVIMLNVVILSVTFFIDVLSVVMLSVVMLSVVMLSVVAPSFMLKKAFLLPTRTILMKLFLSVEPNLAESFVLF